MSAARQDSPWRTRTLTPPDTLGSGRTRTGPEVRRAIAKLRSASSQRIGSTPHLNPPSVRSVRRALKPMKAPVAVGLGHEEGPRRLNAPAAYTAEKLRRSRRSTASCVVTAADFWPSVVRCPSNLLGDA